jgi:hypothetical protein
MLDDVSAVRQNWQNERCYCISWGFEVKYARFSFLLFLFAIRGEKSPKSSFFPSHNQISTRTSCPRL